MTNLHVITMKRKIISAFYPIADLGVSTVTNRIGCRHLITYGGTKHWVAYKSELILSLLMQVILVSILHLFYN